MFERARPALVAITGLAWMAAASAQTSANPPGTLERVTFDEAIARAIDRHPTVQEAAQAILRAQALMTLVSSVTRPSIYANASTTVLDDARGFDGNITQPRTQTTFNGTVSFAFLAASRWAAKNHAADQVTVARISAEDVRRQVALTAAQSYLAVVDAERQRDIALRNLDTAKALTEYARARLDAGQGSRLNHVRSLQELASAEGLLDVAELGVHQAQEALGIALFADNPVDANGDPEIRRPTPPSDEGTWLNQRPDVRLFTAQYTAADNIVRDNWKSWLPEGTASFTPQFVTPKGFFEPAKTWRAFFGLQIPIYDGSLGATRRIRVADRESARLRLDTVKLQARSERRLTQDAVTRHEQISAASRRSAESAIEVLRITEIAYRAGATSNIEVVQAQQTARNTEILAAVAEDRLRQARLDLLVALGQFP